MKQYFEDLNEEYEEYCGKRSIKKPHIKEWKEQLDTNESHNNQRVDERSRQINQIAPKKYTQTLCGWIILSPPQNIAIKSINTIEEVKWHSRLQSGDELHVFAKVLEKNLNSNNRSNFPEVRLKVIGKNQNEEKVITYLAYAIVETNT